MSIKRTQMLTCFWKIKAWMGVIFCLLCAWKHESNPSTNICTTVGKKKQWYVEKCNFLSRTTFIPYIMTVWCVFFNQSVYVFTNGVYDFFITIATACFYEFCKTVLVKKTHLAKVWFDFPLTNAIYEFYSGFYVVVNNTIKAPLSFRTTWKSGLRALLSNSHQGLCAQTLQTRDLKTTSQPTFLLHVLPKV